ncbi:DUF2851 family protein [Luteirhabdus pelagi]|jgi:hypothetical protein|uniref:DUF2851 family protein n=1 Tax=Luteirhabdus pelagi TaxID=2792783 RepID=UPI001939F2C6|nr:DUF2851 family protein [Luteirhabdus pelagi]
MREEFLHFIWKYQKFSKLSLQTVSGETIEIKSPGQHNHNSGPDFFNASLQIDTQKWAGNVEIHLRASDWYAHGHESDPAYDSVILHVVYDYDKDIFRKDGSAIPTLELKNYLDSTMLQQYQKLFEVNRNWIPCQDMIATVSEFTLKNWLERLFIERLEEKATPIKTELSKSHYHWEAIFLRRLLISFGLKVNREPFSLIARLLSYEVLQKTKSNLFQLEALLFGMAGLLVKDLKDEYYLELQNEYAYLCQKFQLSPTVQQIPKFSRLRPPNFPTLRLAQFAALLHQHDRLFDACMQLKNSEEAYAFFSVSPSDYWKMHFNFGTTSSPKEKSLSNSFIDLLLINAVLPIKFQYAKHRFTEDPETIVAFSLHLKPETNTIIKRFKKLQLPVASAMESQALLQLYNQYCIRSKCLDCAIGASLLKP